MRVALISGVPVATVVFLLAELILVLSARSASAAHITLVLREDGGFQISGELRLRRQAVYYHQSLVQPNGGRFECVSGRCPTGPVRPAVSSVRLFASGAPSTMLVADFNTVGGQLMLMLINGFASKWQLKVI